MATVCALDLLSTTVCALAAFKELIAVIVLALSASHGLMLRLRIILRTQGQSVLVWDFAIALKENAHVGLASQEEHANT